MPKMDISEIKFAKLYPLYLQKVERKGRTKAELDQVICWLTGLDQGGLDGRMTGDQDLQKSKGSSAVSA